MRVAAAAAGLVLAGVVAPVAAAPRGTITLQGSTSVWTTFDVPAGITMDHRAMTVTSAGRFGGFYVDFRGEFNLGALWLRDYHPPSEPGGHVTGLGPTREVPRGRHRIYLVADGPTTVRIPVTGMTSRTLRPTRRTTASLTVQHLPRKGLGVAGRQPVLAAPRSVSFSSIMLDDTMVFAGTLAVCLTEPEGICNSGGWDSSRFGWLVNPYGAHPFVFTISYAPGARAGRLDAVQSAENVAGIAYALGASFTLALV